MKEELKKKKRKKKENFFRLFLLLLPQRNWRLSDEPVKEDEDQELLSIEARNQIKCKIFFAFTSNMISSGVREVIRYLVQHKMVELKKNNLDFNSSYFL